jgi:hypothetical protein
MLFFSITIFPCEQTNIMSWRCEEHAIAAHLVHHKPLQCNRQLKPLL